MDKTDHDKTDRSDNCVYQCDDRLCLENQPKSSSYFFRDDSPLIIEKSKISIFYLSEEFFYSFSIDDEEVGKDQCDKKFRQNNPSICDVSDRFLSDRFEIIRADHITDETTESKFEAGTFFDFYDEVFPLEGDVWCFFEKSLDFTSYLRDDIHEYENHDTDKYNVESSNDDICCCIFLSDDMSPVSLATDSPCMDLGSKIRTKLEEYIGKEECHKKENEKIF